MKKILTYFLVFLLVFSSPVLSFFSITSFADDVTNQKTKLATPTNVHWVDGEAMTIAWDPVPNAYQYRLSWEVEGESYGDPFSTTPNTSFDLLWRISATENSNQTSFNGKTIIVKVKAEVSTNDAEQYLNYYDSDYSDSASKIYSGSSAKTKLATPTNVHWVDGEAMTIAWDPVPNAYQYRLSWEVEGESYGDPFSTTPNTSFDLLWRISATENSNQISFNGKTIVVKVMALVSTYDAEQYLNYYDSDYSDSASKIYSGSSAKTKLATPTNVHWVDGEAMTIAWDPVPNAYQYRLSWEVEGESYGDPFSTTPNTSFDLLWRISATENSNQTSFNGKTIIVKVKAEVSTNDAEQYLNYYDSDYSDSASKIFVRPMTVKTDDGIEIIQTNELFEILKNSLTNEQQAEVNGKELEFDFIISDLQESSEGTSEITSYSTQNNLTVGKFFDLSLVIKADGEEIGHVTTTAATISATVDIPDELQAPNRTFIILQNHDGTITEVGRGTGNSVPIEVDRFSAYAIAYYDELPEEQNNDKKDDSNTNPNQGDNNKKDDATNPDQGNGNKDDSNANPGQGDNNKKDDAANPDQGNSNKDDSNASPDQGDNNKKDDATNPDQDNGNKDDSNANPDQGDDSQKGDAVKPGKGGATPQSGKTNDKGGSEADHLHNYEWLEDSEGNLEYKCKDCGATSGNKIAANKYAKFQEETTGKIKKATNNKVTISTDTWMSFHKAVIDELAQHPKLELTVEYKDSGKRYSTTIPAGYDVNKLLDKNGYVGFLYLNKIFGRKELN